MKRDSILLFMLGRFMRAPFHYAIRLYGGIFSIFLCRLDPTRRSTRQRSFAVKCVFVIVYVHDKRSFEMTHTDVHRLPSILFIWFEHFGNNVRYFTNLPLNPYPYTLSSNSTLFVYETTT